MARLLLLPGGMKSRVKHLKGDIFLPLIFHSLFVLSQPLLSASISQHLSWQLEVAARSNTGTEPTRQPHSILPLPKIRGRYKPKKNTDRIAFLRKSIEKMRWEKA